MRIPHPQALASNTGLAASVAIILAIFVLSVTLLGFMVGSLINGVLALAYVTWVQLKIRPPVAVAEEPAPEIPRPWLSALSAAVLIGLSFAFALLNIAAAVGIALLAYPELWLPLDRPNLVNALITVAILLVIVLPAVCFAITYLLLSQFSHSKILRRIMAWHGLRGRPPIAAWDMLLGMIPIFAALVGTLPLVVFDDTVGLAASESNLSWGDHSYGVLLGYPYALYMLVGAALGLAAMPALRAFYCRLYETLASPGDEAATLKGRAVDRWPALTAGLAGLAMVSLGLGGTLAGGVVMSFSGVPTVGLAMNSDEAIRDWLERMAREGVEAKVVAEQLNTAGRWHSHAPAEGLAGLLSDSETFALADDISCTARLAAAPLGADENTANDDDSDEPPLAKYCYRVDCRWTGFREPHG
ncbi:MAG: hypothetical protein QGF53_01485, partial [Alphaproteobacteria bacterium]|nr:hypothetical protein [Alphaproteobacteria bacterium]